MANLNPCCCMSLQRGTVILAIIDAVLNGILLALMILAFVGAILIDPEDPQYEITKSQKTQLIIFCLFSIIIAVCQIILAVFLRRSANGSDYFGLKKWLIITVILFAISIISIAIRTSAGSSALDLTSGIIGIVYRVYVMYVVFSFMKEINAGGGGAHNYETNVHAGP